LGVLCCQTGAGMNTYHKPVMINEVLTGLNIEKGKQYIDATLGGGGHAWEIYRRGGKLLGLDKDRDAIAYFKNLLAGQNIILSGMTEKKIRDDDRGINLNLEVMQYPNLMLVQGNFRYLDLVCQTVGIPFADGIIFDLGVSSHQLDTPQRGFSYRFTDADLDMRFDNSVGLNVKSIIRTATKEELYEIFAKYSEEKFSRSIADAIYRTRSIKPIEKTGQLISVIEKACPDKRNLKKILSRIFQALRIATNDEITALKDGILAAGKILKPGGRLAVITFHSVEDRVTKLEMRKSCWKDITGKPRTAAPGEIFLNSRARSAKLRIAEKI